MRALLSSPNSQYLAFVRIALERERIAFRDTGDNPFSYHAIVPTTIYLVNDADYDRARAVIEHLNEESTSTSLLLPPTKSRTVLEILFIGIVALGVISLVVGFIHEAIRAYHS